MEEVVVVPAAAEDEVEKEEVVVDVFDACGHGLGTSGSCLKLGLLPPQAPNVRGERTVQSEVR
ncbi:hypothetical protein INO15_13950, partial [Staphylococcus aureus]|nr:hypothetical protein [Staphylococcus aureus]